METIREAGARFRSLSEPWADTTTHAGQLIMTVFAGIADYAESASMQSGNPKLVLWRGLHGCSALHNAGPSTEGTRRYSRRLEEAGSALYRPQPRLAGLREGSSSASPSQPNA
jgi:hypothetical protein